MPRFYFNVYDGVSEPDREGSELPDWQTARLEAIRLAGAVVHDDAKHIARGGDWRMEVVDEHGLVLFRFAFTDLGAPAVTHEPAGLREHR